MSVSVIGLTQCKDRNWMKEYGPRAEKVARKYGGKYQVRTDKISRLEGEPLAFIAIIEFPSRKNIDEWLNDPEFIELKAFRLANSYCDTWAVEAVE